MADLKDFYNEITTNINYYLAEAGSRKPAFTLYVMKEMQEKASLGDICVCYDRQTNTRGAIGEINGYAISLNGEKVTLFYTLLDETDPTQIPKITALIYQNAVKKLQYYYEIAKKGTHLDEMPKQSDKYRINEYIRFDGKDVYSKSKNNDWVGITTVQLVVISNGLIPKCQNPKITIEGLNVSIVTWDIAQLYNNIYSDSDRIDVDIDLVNDEQFNKYKLPYLKMRSEISNYDAYVVIVPGGFLYSAYEKHNIDLLQSNLRYFKGNTVINKGMFSTIKETPHRFLAYNNGLTAIATGVKLKENADGLSGIIEELYGFQIVNGGQTTASIYTTKKKYPNVDLGPIFVQMKLIVISEGVDEILPFITKYSNSQNKVPNSDFSSNSKFCINVSDLSKSVLAPDKNGVGNYTHWFFCKFSNQYEREKDNAKAKGQLEAWVKLNPPSQKFDKIQMAKVYCSWNQIPGAVAKGGQYCYKKFYEEYVEGKDKITVDRIFYENLVAQLIIFKYLETESAAFKEFGDYRSQIIPYAISMLNYQTNNRISLLKIWKQQAVSPEICNFLDSIGAQLFERIKQLCPEGRNLRTFCSTLATWEIIKQESFDLSLIANLSECYKDNGEDSNRLKDLQTHISTEDYKYVLQYNAKFWYGLSTYTDIYNNSECNFIQKLANVILTDNIPNEGLILKAKDYLFKFEENNLDKEEVKANSNIPDRDFDISLIDKKSRVSKITEQGWNDILDLAKRFADKGQINIVNKFANAKLCKKHTMTDYNIVCQVLDEVNRKYRTEF